MLAWLGYKGKKAKCAYTNLIKGMDLRKDIDWFYYTVDEYAIFRIAVGLACNGRHYPFTKQSKPRKKYLLLTPSTFKSTLMRVLTTAHVELRRYCIDIDQLCSVYGTYESEYWRHRYHLLVNEQMRALPNIDERIESIAYGDPVLEPSQSLLSLSISRPMSTIAPTSLTLPTVPTSPIPTPIPTSYNDMITSNERSVSEEIDKPDVIEIPSDGGL
jgi:hypothetical protein